MPVFGIQVITETGTLLGETEYEGQFSVNSLIEALAKENSAWTGQLVLPSHKKRGLGGDELLQGDCNFILLQTVQGGTLVIAGPPLKAFMAAFGKNYNDVRKIMSNQKASELSVIFQF